MLTVGVLRKYINGLDDNMPVVVHVNTGDLYIRITEGLNVTTAQGDDDDNDELEITWEPTALDAYR